MSAIVPTQIKILTNENYDNANQKATSECRLQAVVNEDTLLPMMFLGLCKLGNICYGHKMFLNKIRNIFCVPGTKFVSATNVACAGKQGNICVGNNVSSFARAFKIILSWFHISKGL